MKPQKERTDTGVTAAKQVSPACPSPLEGQITVSGSQAKNIPVFRRESIEAMSPLERMIADEMERDGWIRIVDDRAGIS